MNTTLLRCRRAYAVLAVALLATALRAAASAAAENPPAPGFDAAGSDARAVEIADRTMEAMGGRAAWDATRVIAWTIFNRSHVWDRWTGDYRLTADTTLVIVNVNTRAGRAWQKGVEVTDAAKRDEILTRAVSIWINDSYWLLMPYKLKDSGVTLKYAGESATGDGRAADAIELTFRGVGDTPDNRYRVWVDRGTGLVSQWSFFRDAADAEPRFTLPWTDWQRFGAIMLSTGRGRTDVTGIRVSGAADEAAFAGP